MTSAPYGRRDAPVRIVLITVMVALLTLLLLLAFSAMAAASTHEHSHEHAPATTVPPSDGPVDPHAGHLSEQPGPADSHEHDPTTVEAPADRPRAEVLGAFAAVNGAVLVGAAVLRRRSPARSRR